jgi:hypothetical protein
MIPKPGKEAWDDASVIPRYEESQKDVVVSREPEPSGVSRESTIVKKSC